MVQLANLLGVEGRLPDRRRQLAAILLERSWGWISPSSARKLKEKPPESTAPSAIHSLVTRVPLADCLVVPLQPAFLFLLMDQGQLYNFVVGPLSLDCLDGSSLLNFTELFDVRIDGIESGSKTQMRLRGTQEAIQQAAQYLEAKQKVSFAGFPRRS